MLLLLSLAYRSTCCLISYAVMDATKTRLSLPPTSGVQLQRVTQGWERIT